MTSDGGVRDPRKEVAEFMLMSDQPVRTSPCVPPDEEVRLRLRLIAEEFFELLEASLQCSLDPAKDLAPAFGEVWHCIDTFPVRVDLPELADALADLRYVIHGTDHAFGIDGSKVDELVHRSNMEKRNGGKDENGKWTKPQGWKPPDIEGELRRQSQGNEVATQDEPVA